MGYFSNGTEGDMYEAEYCQRCQNYRKRYGEDFAHCPVLEIHMLYNYDQFAKTKVSKTIKDILSELIPRGKVFNEECTMFLKRVDANQQESL